MSNKKKEQQIRCTHDYGWLTDRPIYLAIREDGSIAFGTRGWNRKLGKIELRCNIPECKATRNAYVSGRVVKFGKIHDDTLKQWIRKNLLVKEVVH